MEKLGSIKTKIGVLQREHILYAALIVLGFLFICISAFDMVHSQIENATARAEYDRLRELYSETPVRPAVADTGYRPPLPPAIADVLPSGVSEASEPDIAVDEHPDPMAGFIELNPDFVGWITIDGVIDYPVVQGPDNLYYLKTTFSGKRNSKGAIFMDYRCAGDFSDPVTMIHGHNSWDGSMFARLNLYLDPAFVDENPDIVFATPEGEVHLYRIFSAGLVDAWSRVYNLGFKDIEAAARILPGAPDGASRFLLLSTCTDSEDKNERMLVCAALMD